MLREMLMTGLLARARMLVLGILALSPATSFCQDFVSHTLVPISEGRERLCATSVGNRANVCRGEQQQRAEERCGRL